MSNNPLHAVSNVIELKPDKRYLLVFSGKDESGEVLRELARTLREMGMQGIAIALRKGQDLTVIEAPEQGATPAYCAVGNHAIAQGEDDFRCHYCHRSVCKAHLGNPDALPGDLIACINHVEEVRQQELAFRASWARKRKMQ